MGIWERLALDPAVHRLVALVGGGGKSSTMYAMVRQAMDLELTVVLTTTTHILFVWGKECISSLKVEDFPYFTPPLSASHRRSRRAPCPAGGAPGGHPGGL